MVPGMLARINNALMQARDAKEVMKARAIAGCPSNKLGVGCLGGKGGVRN